MFTNNVKRKGNFTLKVKGYPRGSSRDLTGTTIGLYSNGLQLYKKIGYYEVTGGSQPYENVYQFGVLDYSTNKEIYGQNQKTLGPNTNVLRISPGTITPVDRDVTYYIYDTDRVINIATAVGTVNGSSTLDVGSGVYDEFYKFMNLEILSLRTCLPTEINNLPQRKLREVYIYDASVLINFDVPSNIETLLIWNNATLLESSTGNFFQGIEANTNLKNIELGILLFNAMQRPTTGFSSIDLSQHDKIEKLYLPCNNTSGSVLLNDFNNITDFQLDNHATYNDSSKLITILEQPNLKRYVLSRLPNNTINYDINFNSTSNITRLGFTSTSYNGNISISDNNAEQLNIKSTNNGLNSLTLSNLPSFTILYLQDCTNVNTVFELMDLPRLRDIRILDTTFNFSINSNFTTQLANLPDLSTLLLDANPDSVPFTDFDLSSVSKLSNFDFWNMPITGTITLPAIPANGGKFGGFRLRNMPNLTTLENFSNFNEPVGNAYIEFSNTGLDLDFTHFIKIRRIRGQESPQTVVDISNALPFTDCLGIDFYKCPNLTTVKYYNTPDVNHRANINLYTNPNLTVVDNLQNLIPDNDNRTMNFSKCTLLNIPIPINSTRNFSVYSLSNCAFDQNNVDNLLNDIWANISTFTRPSGNSINITGGTNAIPSGIYQDSLGNPTSPQEIIWELVNNYNWSISTN